MVSVRRCAICSQPALPGGRLCEPCKSALKRARDTTQSEVLLPPRRQRRRPERRESLTPGGDPRPNEGVAVQRTPALPARPAEPASRDLRYGAAVAALALLALIASGAWVAHVRGAGGEVAPRYAVEDRATAEDSVRVAVRVDELRPDSAPGVSTSPPAPVDPGRSVAPAAEARLGPPARGTANRHTLAIAAPDTAPQGPAGSPPAPLEADPPAVATAGRVEIARTEPDRWQALADTLAACPTSDVFARTVCVQSARIEHCTGAWGRSPLCPPPVERDHGN